ncbi:MAG: hypothetical protein LBN03_01450 [Bifidobacteriaceae bacterium]|jgi:4-diphosphocytidyl-2-C-methyl-D-erythritol kinase|nr:hypothetical protein [Bifidobacteriaceae bacterium]
MYEFEDSIKAYGKVNLKLKIRGTDEKGYHLLYTIFCKAPIYDTVKLSVAADDSDGTIIINGEHNKTDDLVYKAIKSYYSDMPNYTFYVDYEKNIPIGGGMAGGSSDAAAIIILLERFSGKLPEETRMNVLTGLGADVAVMYKINNGEGDIFEGTHYGEVLNKLIVPVPEIEIYKMDTQLSTAFVFDTYDKMGGSGDNDLEDAARYIVPEIGVKLDELRREFPDDKVMLSGSGATIFRIKKHTRI